MPGSFMRQFAALSRKNWIVMWRSKWVNLFRCLLLPVAYAAFFAQAQSFFAFFGVLGKGSIHPLQPIPPDLRNFKLVYSLHPTNITSFELGQELMRRVLADANLSPSAEVVRVLNSGRVDRECPQNFAGLSECWAGVAMFDVDPVNQILNYTLRGDQGLTTLDVDDPSKDDIQSRFLPLQWAIDRHFINMSTGVFPPTPDVWQYTNESNEELRDFNRLNYLAGIRGLIVLAHFVVFLGVIYQLPGSMASERSQLLTSHLEAMGCRRSARLISWHLSISAAYLPAWIIVAVVFQRFIYTHTPMGLMIVLYIVTGLSAASWTQLVVVGFANASTLAAISSAFLAIILAIIALIVRSNTVVQLVLTLIFPPTFYVFFTKGLSSWERFSDGIRIGRIGPERDAPTLALLIVAIINIFLFPLLAAWAESKIYGVRPPDYVGHVRRLFRGKRERVDQEPLPEGTAVRIEHLRKVYSSKFLGVGRRKDVVAIEDLSFDVPKGEIFCLLGRNGAAKSTTLHIIARLISATAGKVRFAKDLHLGIASQRDVLWDELTCEQHIKLWRDVKSTRTSHQDEPDLELLARCDLGPKVKFLSKNLSGGQKRKLQLACALAGGSNLILLDEVSSGLDPLSRRAIWKLISANRGRASVVLTTHFLDEADYLGDAVAILQQPGKLLALDNPVALKTDLGKGFVLSVDTTPQRHVLGQDWDEAAEGMVRHEAKGKEMYFTASAEYEPIRRLVKVLEAQRREGKDVRYQVNSATLEQVFLDLNEEPGGNAGSTRTSLLGAGAGVGTGVGTKDTTSSGETSVVEADIGPEIEPEAVLRQDADADDKNLSARDEKDLPIEGHAGVVLPIAPLKPTYPPTSEQSGLKLTPGRKRNYLLSIPIDAYTVFRKRLIVLRRAWLLPLIGIVVVLVAALVPLFFMSDRVQTCAIEVRNRRLQRLSYPFSIYPALFSPPVLAPSTALGAATNIIGPFISTQSDNVSFVDYFNAVGLRNNTYGGVSLASDVGAQRSLFAFESTILQQKGQSSLNLLSNAMLNQLVAPNITGIGLGQVGRVFRINTDFRFLASPSFLSTAQAIKWVAFMGLAMGVWPSFAVIYPTQERANSVRANQYSNGATPVALWLGHLLFELPGILLVSTLLTILFTVLSSQFTALGYLWVCLVLYGIGATIYAFMFALFLNSALASWALVVGSNVVLFMLYLAAYLLILTYDKSVNASRNTVIMHYTVSLINPVPSILRAVLVSINMFNLLCDGIGNYSSNPFSHISQFGGPILYLVMQILFGFGVLVYVDSGAPVPRWLSRGRIKGAHMQGATITGAGAGGHGHGRGCGADVVAEKERLEGGAGDMLQVRELSKRYPGAKTLAVDEVSFGTAVGDNFALIGPNGAGKTTTLACIRGVEVPSKGDVLVSDYSIIRQRNKARAQLGVCPQFNAIDQHLTVSQHLWVYGRLKGVPSSLLGADIRALLHAAGLEPKADQLATSLSGGNQRKLSLAMALIGDRPAILIDEFSSGVDPFSKREAWATLAALTKDRAVVMTTHSMEEVDALSNRVGIVASKLLAVGTPASLKSRYATYEIHLPASSVDGVIEYLHERGFGGAARSPDTLTRIAVPGVREEEVGRLLEVLRGVKVDLSVDVTLHEASTETAFLSIVREHNVREEEGKRAPGPAWYKRAFGKG